MVKNVSFFIPRYNLHSFKFIRSLNLQKIWSTFMQKLVETEPTIPICSPDFSLNFTFSEKATKIDKIFTINLTVCSNRQIDGEDFFNFCALLRKPELYDRIAFYCNNSAIIWGIFMWYCDIVKEISKKGFPFIMLSRYIQGH